MKLSELLSKYENNNVLKQLLTNSLTKANSFVSIAPDNDNYVIESTPLFNSILQATQTKIIINKNLDLISASCGCLNFYKNKECVHSVALYILSIYILDNNKYQDEYEEYEKHKLLTHHSQILAKLSTELRSSNPYFGLIHLIPVIEEENNEYTLSLKIGFDKDYVVKDINEFVNMTEKNIRYSYGQKLDFVHSYECFDPISKEFYIFVKNIISAETSKSIQIRKSHLLKILEIYKNNFILYKASYNLKAMPRKIEQTGYAIVKLNKNHLYISTPNESSVFVCGVNYAYFIDDEVIYMYPYKSRMEAKLFNCLYDVNGSLIVDVNSTEFISQLLPLIKNSIEIDNEFYEKYPVPNIKVNSYFSYVNDSIILNPKIACKEIDKNSPYLKQLLDGYLKTIEGFSFIRNKDKKYHLGDLALQYRFLTSDLSPIKAFGEVFFDENMKSIKAKKSSRTRVNVSFNVGLLNFEFENNDLSLEDIEAMLKAYHENKRFVRLKDNSILEINEENAKEIDNFLEDFNIKPKDLLKPIEKPLNYLLKLVSGQDSNVSMDDEVVRMVQTLQNYKSSKYKPTSFFENILRPYQLEGFKWLKTLASFSFGGILADDMGLGKTIEVIAFLESDTANKPSLIVCPMSLIYNWEIECEKWNFSSDIKLIIGSSDDRAHIIASIDENKKTLYITSYDSLRRDYELYNTTFRFVIADEAQYIKNQYAQKSEAIKSIKSEINYALTGTPIENGLADLWSIFDFLMPGYLSNYSYFKSRYESLIQHDDIETLTMLKHRVSPFILRRTKKDVLKDLPDKIEDYYYCKMQPKQKEIYDSYVARLKDDINQGGNNVLALLTRLRQICITPELILQEKFDNTKINMAVELIKTSIDSCHRILVFSQFSQSFPIISKELESMNIRHFILDGTTKAKSRIEMVSEFNENEDIKVFIISLKAGGTGLNLVGADTVIHLDPWWNSSAEAQATDRAYRIGQTKNVTVIKLICKDTIEEKVIELQKLKKDLADSIVVSDESKNFKLTKNDILQLLE